MLALPFLEKGLLPGDTIGAEILGVLNTVVLHSDHALVSSVLLWLLHAARLRVKRVRGLGAV